MTPYPFRPKRKTVLTAIFLAIASIGMVLPLTDFGGTFKLGGTGASLGTMHLLGGAFTKSNPDTTVAIMPSLGTGGGIRAFSWLDLATTRLFPKESASSFFRIRRALKIMALKKIILANSAPDAELQKIDSFYEPLFRIAA